jgi:molecular chaperone GrpE
MTADNEAPEEQFESATTAEGAADQAAPEAGAGATDESAPEGAVAVEEQAPEAEVVIDPLEGKTDEEIRGLAIDGGEYLALAQRTRADFDNYRKRTQRDLAAAKVRGSVELARELLPALDNVERAIEHEAASVGDHEGAERILEALRTAQNELVGALERGGIVRLGQVGEAFDPTFHEAIARRPVEEGEASGAVGVVYQPGYAAGDEIVRPARVVVTD